MDGEIKVVKYGSFVAVDNHIDVTTLLDDIRNVFVVLKLNKAAKDSLNLLNLGKPRKRRKMLINKSRTETRTGD